MLVAQRCFTFWPLTALLTLLFISVYLNMAETSVRKRKKSSKTDVVENNDGSTTGQEGPPAEPRYRYGPMPTFPSQRLWTRAVLVGCVSLILYFSSKKGKETIFASQKDVLERRAHDVPCSESYKLEFSKFKGCVPDRCGRVVSDTIITSNEVDTLLSVAKAGFALGGSHGGASILDLHSGALSHGQDFVNFYKLPEAVDVIKPEDFVTYKVVKTKIQQAISQHFGIQSKALFLTHPTFFSRLTNAPPKTIHDEYWHRHVDKETYKSFHYTSLLYLNDYKKDFQGGRFIFINADNSTTVVEPKKGRVSMFTSGEENPHYVEQVASGTRYAITVSFTCDPRQGIADPRPAY